jgi:hypothetical protein
MWVTDSSYELAQCGIRVWLLSHVDTHLIGHRKV